MHNYYQPGKSTFIYFIMYHLRVVAMTSHRGQTYQQGVTIPLGLTEISTSSVMDMVCYSNNSFGCSDTRIYCLTDYKLALKEFTMVSGQIPLPPRYAFGIFYSRYWAYDDIGEMVNLH